MVETTSGDSPWFSLFWSESQAFLSAIGVFYAILFLGWATRKWKLMFPYCFFSLTLAFWNIIIFSLLGSQWVSYMNAFKQLSITFPELVRAYASATSVFSLLAVVVLGIVIVFHCINFIGVVLGKRPVNERDPRDENICLQFYCNIGLIFCWYHTSSSMQAKLPDADYNNMRGIEKYGQVTTQDSVQELGQIYLFSMMVSWVIVAFALNLFRLGLGSVLLQINEKWFHMNFQVEEDIEMQRPAAAPVPPEDSVEPHATPTSDANVVTPQPPHYDYMPCPIDNPPPY